jgi:hypothetical protein
MIRQTICLILLFITCLYSYGQTVLSPGDIAITGYNSTDNISFSNGIFNLLFFTFTTDITTTTDNEFTFILLNDIDSGTSIRFTDNGWRSDNTFRANEGVIIWTADSDLACGTEITINTGNVLETFEFFGTRTIRDEGFFSASIGSIDGTDFENFELGLSGDQILAYQGTDASPSFVFALNFNGGNWRGGGAINDQTSALPFGLSGGINEVSVRERDNGNYDCTVIQGTSLILEAICNKNNWNTSDTRFSPLGGCSYRCGPCGSIIIWNGTWSGQPNLTTEVIFESDYNTSSGSIQACSITVDSGATITISNNSYIEIENNATINGDLIIETNGNFVQNGVGSLAGTFTGTATLNKTTPVKSEWYYYTYWSSPVIGETIGNVFPNVLFDWRYSFNAANFVDTDGDDIDDYGNDWQIAAAGDTMTPGIGYAVAGERSSSGSYPKEDNISFTGAFNTGDITIPITYNVANPNMRWNFIGNPYPSAIDFVAFHLTNSSVLEGVAYFWDHGTPPDAGNLSQSDYAVFTVGTGGIGARSDTGAKPNGFIGSGQGFFIPALASLTSSSGHSATFTNAMRKPDNTSNNQFFKGSSSKKSNASAINPLENRLWVNLTSDNGVFNQILVGYVENATDAFDGMSYDAPKLLNPGYAAVLYSTMDNDDTKYVIQGKDITSINEDEIIKLGINTNIEVATIYTLSIDSFEGEFLNNNAIYLKDNLLDTIHNLSDSDYTFTSEAGEFNDRFEIVFKENALSLDNNDLDNNLLSIVDLNNDNVQFRTSENLTIKTVAIFDLLGRQLYDLKGNTNSETYKLSDLSSAAYIVKVQLSNGVVINKKIIKN